MRLLNTRTGLFEEFQNHSSIPRYAILSHTWSPEGEQTYQDVKNVQETYKHDALKQGESHPVTDSAAVTEPERDNPFEPIQSDVVIPVYPIEVVVGRSSGHSEGASALALARTLLPLLMYSSVPSQAPRLANGRNEPRTLASHPLVMVAGVLTAGRGLCEKIRGACAMARREGYEYIWVDSSCINKESSSELSEAINSMYDWYGRAQVCLVFLSDVPKDDDVSARDSAFRRSRWFKRGWTLQELIAPGRVLFFSSEWTFLGTKVTLLDVIYDITRIDGDVLLHTKSLDEASVAQRMSWASTRKTTRVEDEAYSLLGIFGINMPTLYGEGAHAFRRLQEEILRRIPDQTLFAWGAIHRGHWQLSRELLEHLSEDTPRMLNGSCQASLFAPSPRPFYWSGRVVRACGETMRVLQHPPLEFAQTPYGIRMRVCLVPKAHAPHLDRLNIAPYTPREINWYTLVLGCEISDEPGELLGILCYVPRNRSGPQLLYTPYIQDWSWGTSTLR